MPYTARWKKKYRKITLLIFKLVLNTLRFHVAFLIFCAILLLLLSLFCSVSYCRCSNEQKRERSNNKMAQNIRKATWKRNVLRTSLKIRRVIFRYCFFQRGLKDYWGKRRDDSLMLATICDEIWDVLNMQHITPTSEKWDNRDKPGGDT